MESMVQKALELATRLHAGQTDKAGKPYIQHPIAVAAKVNRPEEKIVALLHDVVEDTETSLEDIRREFGDVIADAVDCVTKREHETYMEFVARAKGNAIARAVKMADLEHNMDLSRLGHITEKDRERLKKYEEAYRFLNS